MEIEEETDMKVHRLKVIYLSGKIAGEDYDECKEKFEKAGNRIVRRLCKFYEDWDADDAPFYEIFNPMSLPDIGAALFEWADYIMRDLMYLRQCDIIYMLADWQNSPGARVEHEFAKGLGLAIYYESDEETE